jgi:hypothetical protein
MVNICAFSLSRVKSPSGLSVCGLSEEAGMEMWSKLLYDFSQLFWSFWSRIWVFVEGT